MQILIHRFLCLRLFLICSAISSCNNSKNVQGALIGTWYYAGIEADSLECIRYRFEEDLTCFPICKISGEPDSNCSIVSHKYSVTEDDDNIFVNIQGDCIYCGKFQIYCKNKRNENMILSDTLVFQNSNIKFEVVRFFSSDYQMENWQRFWPQNKE